MNEIILYFQNAMTLPYPVKKSKIIKNYNNIVERIKIRITK